LDSKNKNVGTESMTASTWTPKSTSNLISTLP
jgi:hypothetical protein